MEASLPQPRPLCIAPSRMHDPTPRPNRPILLVGMPGSGKSTIGPLLAARLRLPFHDSDTIIEGRLGLDVTEIFDRLGEGRFRSEEKTLLAELIEGPPAVIAAGGGAFLDPDVRALAADRAVAIWLAADLGTLQRRLRDKMDRPLLAGEGALAEFQAQRDPVYALAAIRVDAASAPACVVEAIIGALSEPAK